MPTRIRPCRLGPEGEWVVLAMLRKSGDGPPDDWLVTETVSSAVRGELATHVEGDKLPLPKIQAHPLQPRGETFSHLGGAPKIRP